MTDGIKAVITLTCACLTAACITYMFQLRDTTLSTTASCIERIAKEQGYKGNPSGEEAWSLFASQCK